MTPLFIASILQHPARVSAVVPTCSNVFMTVAWYGHSKHLQASSRVDRGADFLRARPCLMGAVYFNFRN